MPIDKNEESTEQSEKISAEEFRIRSKIVPILIHERSTIDGKEYKAALKSLKSSKDKKRIQGQALSDRFKAYAKTRKIPISEVPQNTALKDGLTVLGFKSEYIKFAKRYISENYTSSKAMALTSSAYPLPYTHKDMGNIKTGNWYLLKRSHTCEGEYSFSRLHLAYDKHPDCEGFTYKYELVKKTDDRLNSVGGFIGRNHGQYMFVGLEAYDPLDDDTVSYLGTQVLMVQKIDMANVLPGIVFNTLNQGGPPCATKTVMFYVEGEPRGKDEDITGVIKKDKVRARAKLIGIDMKNQFRWPDKDTDGKRDKKQKQWGMLIAEL